MIGAFEAHQDTIMRELWIEVLPYFNKNQDYGSREDKVFFSFMNYLDENPNHWVWNKIDADPTIDTEAYLKSISSLLHKESLIVDKKVLNKKTGMEEVQQIKVKEPQYKYPKWLSKRNVKTPNGILVRYSEDKEIAIKAINQGLVMSLDDYKEFKKALTLDLSTLTIANLNKIIYDIQTDPKDPFFSRFTTLKVFYEDLLTELKISPVKKKNNFVKKTYEVGKGFQRKKLGENTIDVFDGI